MPEVSPSASHWHAPGRLKACIRCGEAKPTGEFYSYGYTRSDGIRGLRFESRCRPCARARRLEQYEANREEENRRIAAWRAENVEHRAAYARRRQQDPEVRAGKAKNQRLRKARARSGGKDTPEIRALYALALEAEKVVAQCPLFDIPELGKKMHVDHIIPLARGGKHVIENLQILPIGLNMRKGVRCPR